MSTWVLVVDPQEKRGQAIQRLLERQKGLFRVTRLSVPSELSEAPLTQKPQVVLVSLSLETPAGAQLLKRIQRQFVGIPIVILSPDKEEVEILKALQHVDHPVLSRKGLTLDHLAFVIQQSLYKPKPHKHGPSWDEVTGKFVQMVSHELRTPLSILKAALDTLADTPLTAEQREKVVHAGQKSVDRLWMLIQDHLDLSHMEKGDIKYTIMPKNIYETVAGVVSEFESYAQLKHIAIVNTIDAQVPQVLVDIQKLNRVLDGLVHNAIKFTPTGGQVTLSYVVKSSWIEISVSDTGIGIGKGHEDEIFQKYQQFAEDSQPHDIGGVGLGLTIVKKVIEAHQGKVWVESQMGKGTTVTFTLPMSDEAVASLKKAA